MSTQPQRAVSPGTESACALISDFQPPETGENESLMFQPQLTEMEATPHVSAAAGLESWPRAAVQSQTKKRDQGQSCGLEEPWTGGKVRTAEFLCSSTTESPSSPRAQGWVGSSRLGRDRAALSLFGRFCHPQPLGLAWTPSEHHGLPINCWGLEGFSIRNLSVCLVTLESFRSNRLEGCCWDGNGVLLPDSIDPEADQTHDLGPQSIKVSAPGRGWGN